MGKADNIPFNQLYNLTEDCADRYYTKVIKTLTHLLKNSFHDRQLVLVNSAKVLKFLESYAARQSKLWKVLLKYHNLPDHFHDLKTTLQAEFDLLKNATSKNIENIQEVVQSQQAYTTALCGHITSLYTKLAQLDKQVQTHCLYPHHQSDVVQLNAPDYDLDIDGQPDPVMDLQSPNAKSDKTDTMPNTANLEQHTAHSTDTNRPQLQPSSALDDIDQPGCQDNTHSRAEHPCDYCPQLEDIPELETDEENWEKGQFEDTDLIDHHNTTEESDRIHHKYSAHLRKSQNRNIVPMTAQHLGSNIRFLNQNTITLTHDQNKTKGIKIRMYISLSHTRYGHEHGRAKHLELHSHRLYGEKTRSLESRIVRKCKKNRHLRERSSANI